MASLLYDGSTNKEKWEALLQQNKILVGGIELNRNPNYGTLGNLAVNGSNAITDVVNNNILGTLASPFRAPDDGTLTGQIRSATVGRFQVGSTVDNFLDSSGINSVGNSVIGGVGSVFDAIGTGVAGVAGGIGNAAAVASKKVEGYIAPITEVIETINSLGDQFDEIIKDTFLGQVFKIKGSEILCAMFCIIVSMLSCSTRKKLNDAILSVKSGLANFNSAISDINSMTKTAVEVPLFNEKTVTDNIKSLFAPNKKVDNRTMADILRPETGLDGRSLDNVLNFGKNTQTKTPSAFIDASNDVIQIINGLIQVLSILAKGQITVPVGITGDIWAFAQAVLAIVQQILIQAVDEFLTKVVGKVEKQLKKMMPQMCVGNLAAKFINRITAALRLLKDFLLGELRKLLGDGEGFKLKWKTFGWQFKEITELLAMLQALSLILKKFPELAFQCGISPCNNLPPSELRQIQQAISAGLFLEETNMPAKVVSDIPLPQGKTLDELVDTFKSITGQPNAYAVTSANGDGFHVIMPDMFKDAPIKIQNIINSPDFLTALGGAYTVYQQPDSGMSIVYTYELKC